MSEYFLHYEHNTFYRNLAIGCLGVKRFLLPNVTVFANDIFVNLSLSLVLAATCGLRAGIPVATFCLLVQSGQYQVPATMRWLADPWLGIALLVISAAEVFTAFGNRMSSTDTVWFRRIGILAGAFVPTMLLASAQLLAQLTLGLIVGGSLAFLTARIATVYYKKFSPNPVRFEITRTAITIVLCCCGSFFPFVSAGAVIILFGLAALLLIHTPTAGS